MLAAFYLCPSVEERVQPWISKLHDTSNTAPPSSRIFPEFPLEGPKQDSFVDSTLFYVAHTPLAYFVGPLNTEHFCTCHEACSKLTLRGPLHALRGHKCTDKRCFSARASIFNVARLSVHEERIQPEAKKAPQTLGGLEMKPHLGMGHGVNVLHVLVRGIVTSPRP